MTMNAHPYLMVLPISASPGDDSESPRQTVLNQWKIFAQVRSPLVVGLALAGSEQVCRLSLPNQPHITPVPMVWVGCKV